MSQNELPIVEMVSEMREMIDKLRQEVDALKQENLHLRFTGTQPMPSLDMNWLDDPETTANEEEDVRFSTNLGAPPKVIKAQDEETAMMSSSDLEFCMNTFDLVADSNVSVISVMSSVVDEDISIGEMMVMAQILKKPSTQKTSGTTRRLVLPPPPPIKKISPPPPRAPRAISRFHSLPDGLVVLNRSGMVMRYQETQQNNTTQLQHSPIVGEVFFEIAPYAEVRVLKSHFDRFVRGELDRMAVFDIDYQERGATKKMVLALSNGKEDGLFNLVIKRS